MNARRRARQGRKHWPICPQTGKQRLGERKDAHLALRAARARHAVAHREGVPFHWTVCRSYRCDHCAGWHLTSQPVRGAA